MGDYIKLARITKARKRQGRLVVRMCDGLPFLLEEGMRAHIVPPSLEVPRTVTLRDPAQGEDDTVAFEGIGDYARLVEYVGRYLLVARGDLDPQALAHAPAALGDFTVVDEQLGELGQVVDVAGSAYQDILVVEGPLGEVMVPFVDEFILSVDADAGVVRTRIPPGLVEG